MHETPSEDLFELEKPWATLRHLLDHGEQSEVRAFLGELSSSEAALCIDRLDPVHRDLVLGFLDPESAALLLELLSHAQSGQLLENAEPETAAAILVEMSSAEQADLIAEMPPEAAKQILAEMPEAAAAAAGELASFASDSAGGLMVTRFVAFDGGLTAAAVVAELHRHAEEIRDYEVQYLYVTDRSNRLRGVVPLRELLLTPPTRLIESFMIAEPISVAVDTELEVLADLFEKRSLLGVPVVDGAGALRGVVHRRAVDEAWSKRAEGDFLKTRGIVGGEELRSMPIVLRSRRRLSWLSVNILLNVAAASVIAAHQETLEAVIALAMFLPIISDMSGCSGNQAVAVSMRELTLGIVRPIDVFYVWRKEVSVGLINGVVLGLLLGLAAWAWQGEPMLGAVVGGALALNTVVAVSVGGAVPLVLKRLGVDPALAAGPVLTTLTDMCGFFFALSLAASFLVGR